jgi:nitroreductase
VTDQVSQQALDLLFNDARSHNGWKDKPVNDEQLHAVYNLMRMGPTAANTCPARLHFVKSDEARQKLIECVSEGNVEKCRAAPVVAIIGMDMEFYELLPKLFPHTDARPWFVGKEKVIQDSAFRNSSLQAAYFMLACRSQGLDCGPMSGFDADKMNATFFDGTAIKVNMICAIGTGDPDALFPRSPRLEFDEACKIL